MSDTQSIIKEMESQGYGLQIYRIDGLRVRYKGEEIDIDSSTDVKVIDGLNFLKVDNG